MQTWSQNSNDGTQYKSQVGQQRPEAYIAWTEKLTNLQQPVGDLDSEILLQVVGEIPWGQNRIKTSRHPAGVAEYKLANRLPKKSQAELPTPKELREHLK